METSVAAVTVRVVEPVIPAEAAEIVDVPVVKVEARPTEVIVAAEVLLEAQVALLDRFCVLPSE
jgi:hypothetical protein